MSIIAYLHDIPKVELHLHLEGSIRPQILLQLADRHGVRLPVASIDAIQQWYRFQDFDHFVQIYLTMVSVLRTPDDFALITYDLGKTLAAQNVRYAEVTWTPGLHIEKAGLDFVTVLDGINAGRDRARAESGIDMRWIPDIARNLEVKTANRIAELVSSPMGQAGGVVALGLGGMEVNYPPELFESAFAIARRNGLPANPHAGETVGPASIWGAIRSLQARRIGHGVRAVEDPVLVKYLVEHRIPLEVNPTSNLCLNVFPSYEAHPLKQLVEAGVIVTINSDDPPMFNTTINEEYVHAVLDCGLTLAELEAAALNAIRVSYLPEGRKNAMLTEFEAEYRRLRQQYRINDIETVSQVLSADSNWLERFWENILSRDSARIKVAFAGLEDQVERQSVLQHLTRMVSEDGWAEPQRASAQAALAALNSFVDQAEGAQVKRPPDPPA